MWMQLNRVTHRHTQSSCFYPWTPTVICHHLWERYFKHHISIPSITICINHLKLRQSLLTLRWTHVASAQFSRLQKHSTLTFCEPPLYLVLVGPVSVSSRESGLAGFRLSGSNGEGNGWRQSERESDSRQIKECLLGGREGHFCSPSKCAWISFSSSADPSAVFRMRCGFVHVISVRAITNHTCPKFSCAQEDYSKELSLQLSSVPSQQETLTF